MKHLFFSHNNSLVKKTELNKLIKKSQEEIKKLKQATLLDYDVERSSINLPTDKTLLNNVKKIVNKFSKQKPSYLVVIGIGGSNLGTKAVQEAILGKNYNETNSKTKILYADNVDSNTINNTKRLLEKELKQGKNIILNVISKSGCTTETIANFEILLNLLKKYKEKPEEHIVITTDKYSKLWLLGQQKNYTILETPQKIGGRFSVLSNIGLFPLGILGINLDQLTDGATKIREKCLSEKVNPALISACLIYSHYKKKKNIHNTFLFNDDLEGLGKWYRQLMAESIGKKMDLKKKKVQTGITPIVSIGSTDLHSMLQLYLGGPNDKFTTFVNVEKNPKAKIPKIREFEKLVNNIQGKDLEDVRTAIYKGTKKAYSNDKRPFIEITLPEKKEYYIGQFLQFKMIEIMYLAALLNINPFDQPNVESYKVETRKNLNS